MLKEFSKYTISNILVKATGFIIPFLLAYYYTQAEYGVISLGYAYLNFFSMFYAFGFCEGVQRYYYELRDNNQRDIFGNILLTNFLLVLFFSFIFTLLCFTSTIFNEVSKSIFLMVLFVGYLKALQNIGLSFLQMEKKSSRYIAVSLVSVLSDVLFIVLFVVIIHLPVEFRFVSLVICNLSSTIVILIFIHKYVKKPTSFLPSKFKEILKFSFPCMFLPVMSWLLTTSDKVVMSKLGTMRNVGIYSFCFSLSQLPAILQQGFNTAYTPIFYSEYENKDKIKNVQTVFIELYSFVLLLYMFFISIFFKYVKLFEKYESGIIFVPIFMIPVFFSAISTMNNSHLAYSYNTKVTFLITTITGAVSILLNYIFIKNLNSLGAAISVATTMTIQMLLSFICSIRYGYFAWKLRKLIIVFLFFLLSLFVFKNIVVFVCVLVLYLIYIVLIERTLIKKFVRKHA
ncbi:MAG: oligosaccharide flippase family protein [Treponema sp.]|nr:oligosaccharide flippase family protein [Treponema sp.]